MIPLRHETTLEDVGNADGYSLANPLWLLACFCFAISGTKKPAPWRMQAVYSHFTLWSRRILNPFLKAPICLILQGLPSIVHAFVHVCNFQSMQCQKICVGHVRASIELCLNHSAYKSSIVRGIRPHIRLVTYFCLSNTP